MTLAVLVAMTIGAGSSLGIGDRAPALGYGETIKGNPVRSFSKSKPTVVEFWATWCGPCIQMMPHLSDLWSKYRDRVDFVSVSVLENDFSKVRPFIEKMGDKVTYPVVLDKLDAKGKGFMAKGWLEAARQDGIPCAFIVDKDAKIAWIGHPQRMEPVLTQVIDGTWDAKGFKLKHEAQLKDEESSNRLINDAYSRILHTPRTHAYAASVAWIDANRGKYDGPTAKQALDELRTLFAAFAKSDFETALTLAETETKNTIVWTYFRPMLAVARIDALQSLKRDDWRQAAAKVIEGPFDPNLMIAMGDALAFPDSKLAQTDPALALKVGERLAGMDRNPMFLLRLAWAHHLSGQTDKAKAVLDEAFQKMPQEKKNNPGSYDGMMKSLKEAKAAFEKAGA